MKQVVDSIPDGVNKKEYNGPSWTPKIPHFPSGSMLKGIFEALNFVGRGVYPNIFRSVLAPLKEGVTVGLSTRRLVRLSVGWFVHTSHTS